MRKEVILSAKPATLGAFAALCAALVLMAGGCARTTTRVEKSGTTAADTAVGIARPTTPRPSASPRRGRRRPSPPPRPGMTARSTWRGSSTAARRRTCGSRTSTAKRSRSGRPARVNPQAGEATAWRGDAPTVAVAPDGTVYVGWTARDEAAPHASTLYLSASRDGGRSFGPPSKVNDDAKPGDHGMHSLAVSGDGRVYVAWLDERDIVPKEADPVEGPFAHAHGEQPRGLLRLLDGRRAHLLAEPEGGGRSLPVLQNVARRRARTDASTSAWRQVLPGNFRHIAVASSDRRRATFSPAGIVSDDRWELQGCPVSGAALSAGATARCACSGTRRVRPGRPGLYWSESRDGGRTFSPRAVLAETGGRGTPVLLKGRGRRLQGRVGRERRYHARHHDDGVDR